MEKDKDVFKKFFKVYLRSLLFVVLKSVFPINLSLFFLPFLFLFTRIILMQA
ncbi:MAG: hypothetical protein JXA54_06425 [Candidatus Heimdallarchaeota archaeon]|nr:hypothetical protein [Candidatus Heimdallarchaeota archaeon]